MIRRALIVLLTAAFTFLGVAGTTSAAPAEHPVILVGTGGFTWNDVSPNATPALWSLLEEGSTAALSVRSVNPNTCPIDGWLSLSAGTRAAAPGSGADGARATTDPCPPVPEPTDTSGEGAQVPGWTAYVEAADALMFNAEPGLLGEQFAQSDTCLQAIGPGAAVAAATRDGSVANYTPRSPEALGELGECALTIIDVGSVRDPSDVADGEEVTDSREEQVRRIDARIGDVLAAAPEDANVIVASLSDGGVTPRLRLVAATGPAFPAGDLVSPSTRQPGLVQSADLTVTLLDLAGLEIPDGLGGATLHGDATDDASGTDAQDRLRHLRDYGEAAHDVHPLVPIFFYGLVWAQIAIYGFVLLVWRGRIGSAGTRSRMLGIVRTVALLAASVPASTFLANLLPWWRSDHELAAVVGAVGLFVALISAAALLGPWRRTTTGPVAVVAGATMAVLAVDVMTGSRLQMSSLMGLQPVVGGRFYGMGNVTFSLFATATLMLCTVVADRLLRDGRRATAGAAVIGIGVVAVVIDGAPAWGADGGGPPALIPGIAFLAMSVLGLRLTWQRIVAIGAATVAVFLGVAWLDSLRPTQEQSHLGRFWGSLMNGEALDIVLRKLEQNFMILVGNLNLTILVPIALVFVIYVLARPTSWGSRSLQRAFEHVTTLRAGLIAWVVTMTIGFFINDSGVAIPAVGAAVAIPLLIVISVGALRNEPTQPRPARATARG